MNPGNGNSAQYDTNFFNEISDAATTSGVTVVSISYGWSEPGLAADGMNEQALDAEFTTPGVTFLAASGDTGEYPLANAPIGPAYPATSPNVVAVGGTTLPGLDAAGDYPVPGPSGEIGWSYGSDSWKPNGASGGGVSSVESQPTWQKGVVPSSITTSHRAVPDVAWDADPATGFYVYYSTPDQNGNVGWVIEGGTSIAAPQWAGLIAIADQERVQGDGGTTLTGYTQTLPALYSLPSSDFHDIVNGNNGYPAGPGYDLVTGLGTPVANLLIPDLAAYGIVATKVAITVQPPAASRPAVASGSRLLSRIAPATWSPTTTAK